MKVLGIGGIDEDIDIQVCMWRVSSCEARWVVMQMYLSIGFKVCLKVAEKNEDSSPEIMT